MNFYKSLFWILIILVSKSNAQEKSIVKPFTTGNDNIKAIFNVSTDNSLRQVGILPANYMVDEQTAPKSGGRLVAMFVTGDSNGKHFAETGNKLKFIEKREKIINGGKQLVIVELDTNKNLLVESIFEFNDASPVVKRYTRVTNKSNVNVGLESLSSAMLYNYSSLTPGSYNENIKVSYAYNSYLDEGQWKTYKPADLGIDETSHQTAVADISLVSYGTRSTSKYLPMGMVENVKAGLTWFWQIEHNGSWFWKMSRPGAKSDYVYLSGPDEKNAHAWKNLRPGEVYETVPVGIGCVKGGMNEAVAALTAYRRAVVIRPHVDNVKCPIIFNDYMNCLWADPTTEKSIPLIDEAARLGAEYYCIDAGWYSELGEKWSTTVGLWQPSKTRFKDGLGSLINYIRKKGMKPGLWLEIEVAGVNSPLKTKPDSWFLMRHGKRVIDGGRYLLDFRNPEVITFANGVIDRLIKDFGIKYFKVDYNSGEFLGTDVNADSYGQGLLEHNRALINWYKGIYEKYPDLVIEACASGGARSDYATLSQNQLVSFSDQSTYIRNPSIIVGELAAILPEQLGVWAYPKTDGDAKSASFNMVNGMFCRMYLSGLLNKISTESLKQIETGLKLYKTTFAPIIHKSIPFFPLGMPSMTDLNTPIALGLKNDKKSYIAVWRLDGESEVYIPLPNNSSKLKLVYPKDLNINGLQLNNQLKVTFPDKQMAAIFEVETL